MIYPTSTLIEFHDSTSKHLPTQLRIWSDGSYRHDHDKKGGLRVGFAVQSLVQYATYTPNKLRCKTRLIE